ncbi:hypothetical protein ACHHYP_13816 [Achlya hypogyna]|uniref:Uncharacterized protein n=1 Tax=Achlya hypogyna TaxID=1202772 RepID=A0A1V9ZFB9_ACHHY|nr:hypothetical protein ACHHYP_13816 [Achlya hypogyna]
MATATAATPPTTMAGLPAVRRYVRANSHLSLLLRRKRVSFAPAATTFEFDVAYGGSALPGETGPPIGLARRHARAMTTGLAMHPGVVRKFDHFERIQLLKQAKYDVTDIATFCLEAVATRASRMETRAELLRERLKRPREDDGAEDDDEVKPPQRPR